MPLYEYVCQECGARFEALRSMNDADAAISCKNCLGKHTKRAISVFYASSDGRSVTSTSGCDSCAGGSCSSCSH